MASKPPPIIRSSKPFSVEIPEGSKSAKSRRSDVVPGEEVEIHHKSSQFLDMTFDSSDESVLPNTDADFHHKGVVEPTDPSARLHQAFDTPTENLQKPLAASSTAANNIQTLPTTGTEPAKKPLPAAGNQQKDNVQTIADDSVKDRFAQEGKGAGLQDKLVGDKNNPIKDKLVGEKQNPLKDNLQPVHEDGLSSDEDSFHAVDKLQDNQSGVAKEAIKDRLVGDKAGVPGKQPVKLPSDKAPDNNNIALPDAAVDNNTQALAQETEKSNIQPLPDTALADKPPGLKKDHLSDNLQGVGVEPVKDNVQALDDSDLQDNLQPIDNPAIQDKTAGAQAQALSDNLQGIEDEALDDNLQPLPDQALKAKQQALPDQALADNQQPLADEKLADNLQGLPDEALADNLQPLGDEALQDNVAEIPVAPHAPNEDATVAKDPLQDNMAAEPIAGVNTRDDSLEKTHVQDHVVALPDTYHERKPGPSPVHADPHAPISRGSTPASARPVTGNAANAAHPAATHPNLLSKAEQAKRAEAFHSRVQAIRKSVSGVNHLLDDLQDKS